MRLPARLFSRKTSVRNRNGRVSRYITTWPGSNVTDYQLCGPRELPDPPGPSAQSTGQVRHCPVGECRGVPGRWMRWRFVMFASGRATRGVAATRDVGCSQLITERYTDIRSFSARKQINGTAGTDVATVGPVPSVDLRPLSQADDFRCSIAESLPGSRVVPTHGWSANGPDGSCGGMVSRRNLRGRASSARAEEVSTIPMQVDLRVHDDVALGEIELYAEVLATVAASEGPLSVRELDEALGISHRR
jgi:hypothetical protein